MENMQQLTLVETLDEIKYLIADSNGDTGRLAHILETIKNKKTLYQSDQNFLENKLGATFSLEDEENPPENKIRSKIKDLINNTVGDPMRLKHIYDTISNGKQLYLSDHQYLENKLNFSLDRDEVIIPLNEKNEFFKEKFESDNSTIQEKNLQIKSDEPTSEVMPKGWTPKEVEPTNKLTEIKQEIKTEQEKMELEKKLSDEISLHRSKLTKLTQKRYEYEKQILLEKEALDSKIKEEKEKITSQTKFAEKISVQRVELET